MCQAPVGQSDTRVCGPIKAEAIHAGLITLVRLAARRCICLPRQEHSLPCSCISFCPPYSPRLHPPKMADVSSASSKVYTLEDLQQHKSRDDIWLLINGKVYDVTKFLDEVSLPRHPSLAGRRQGRSPLWTLQACICFLSGLASATYSPERRDASRTARAMQQSIAPRSRVTTEHFGGPGPGTRGSDMSPRTCKS